MISTFNILSPIGAIHGYIVGNSVLGFRKCSLASGMSGRGQWLVFPQEAEHRVSK